MPFTQEDQQEIERLTNTLRESTRGLYVEVRSFEDLKIDGDCSLDALAAFVEGLWRLRTASQPVPPA